MLRVFRADVGVKFMVNCTGVDQKFEVCWSKTSTSLIKKNYFAQRSRELQKMLKLMGSCWVLAYLSFLLVLGWSPHLAAVKVTDLGEESWLSMRFPCHQMLFDAIKRSLVV